MKNILKRKNIHEKQSKPDYEKLGRLLYAVGQSGYGDRRKLYRIAFWKGIWSGLGGVVGATLVVAILLFLFSVLGRIPLVGPPIKYIQKVISEPQSNDSGNSNDSAD